MRVPGGKGLGFFGVAIAALALTSCINFAPAVPSQASSVEAARSVDAAFADVTGDVSEDVIVAVALPGADALVRMATCGSGCLERREQVVLDGDLAGIDTADFDGDGVEDVAAVSSVDVRVYFGGTATAGRPEGLVADDFDDDGDADVGLSSRQLYDFVAGDGEGAFAPLVNVVLLPSRASIGGMVAGDIDGDGDPEVVLTESGLGTSNVLGSVVAFRDGTSVVGSYTEQGRLLTGLAAGDINGDDLDDVAVVRFLPDPINLRDVRLLRSTGSGFTGFGQGGALTSLPSRAVAMELRDIDLDGKVDFLASDGGQLSWWHGSGSGGFAARVDRAAGPALNSLAFGTVGSPRPDLVVANTTAPFGQLSYLTNASQL
jgi:hypothetical protein